jgi:NACHT domain
VNGTHTPELAELRENATVLLNSSQDSIKRHNSYLKGLEDAADALEWETAYRQQVRAAHGYIEPPDFERKRKVPIEDLFVSPQVAEREDSGIRTVCDIWTLANAIDRTVLLGDPGGGKSTACNVITWNSDDLVPFVVVLRTFVDEKQSVVDYIESRLSAYYQCPAPPHVVDGLLLSGRTMVIFDGLDELVDTSKRRQVTERVELFCTRYPLTKVLVTSRRVGYDEAALDPNVFEVYGLAEFSDSDVKSYVIKWFMQVDGAREDKARALAVSFIQESAAVPDLRRNPLMLSLMCIIYRGQNWIPRNRPEMYEHCAKLLFEKWDSSRQIYVDLAASAHVDGAIKQLAYWMFTEAEATQGVREKDLIREATAYLEPAFSSAPEARRAAQQFIEFCRGRGWVLTDVGTTADGEALFAFTHRTFMEYFAAYELTRLHDRPEQIAKVILPHVAAAEWETVAELALQISDKHSRDGAARILRTLLSNKRYSAVTSRYNITRFAMHCLAFIHTPIPLAEEIGRVFIESALHYGAAGKRIEGDRYSIIPDLQPPVESAVLGALGTATAGDILSLRSVAAELIILLPEFMTIRENMAPDLSEYERWAGHRESLFAELRANILSIQDEGIWFATWRKGLITLERLLTEGPNADYFPLSALFRNASLQHVIRGWGDWGSFIPERLLQSGADTEPDFPVTKMEIDWLGRFIDSLGPPPWVTEPRNVHMSRGFDGNFHLHKLATEEGWTLFRLLLIGIEAEFPISPRSVEDNSRKFYNIVGALTRRRQDGKPLPDWLSLVIEDLPPKRHALVAAWLDRDVNFIAD